MWIGSSANEVVKSGSRRATPVTFDVSSGWHGSGNVVEGEGQVDCKVVDKAAVSFARTRSFFFSR